MLVDLPLEKIPELCTILEREWPLTMDAVYFIKGLYSMKTGGNPCPEVSLLYSQNNVQSGILVIVVKGLQNLFISVFALDGFEENLKTELINSSNIWNGDEVRFRNILNRHVGLIEEVSVIKKYHRITRTKEQGLIMPRKHALKLRVSCPKDVKFGPLCENYLDEMYETWPLRTEFTIEVFKQWYELNKKYAVGIFCKTSGALLSRCQRSSMGRISNNYIVDSAQGKGYTRLLLKKLCKMMAEDSIEVYCTVTDRKSFDAMGRIGFVHTYDLNGLVFKKNKKNNTIGVFLKCSSYLQTYW